MNASMYASKLICIKHSTPCIFLLAKVLHNNGCTVKQVILIHFFNHMDRSLKPVKLAAKKNIMHHFQKSKERWNEMMITIAAAIKEKNITVTEKTPSAIIELLSPIGKKEVNLSSGRETDGNVGISASEVGCACSLSGLPNLIASCGLLRLMTTS